MLIEKFGDEYLEYMKVAGRFWPRLGRIIKEKETFAVHMVIREDDKIVGRVLSYRNQNDPKEFNFGNFYYTDEKYFPSLLSTAISKLKELGAETASLFLWDKTLTQLEKYQSFGFSQAGKIDYYEKEI